MGNLSQKDQLYLEKETHHDQVQEDHPIFSCKIWMDLIHQTRNSNNSNKCVQCAPYLHGMDCISKYIEVKIKDKVANIRCPSKNYEQFLDPLFAGKSYQNHCLMSCVIFYAS